MQQRDGHVGQRCAYAPLELGREVDLRNQQQHLAARRDHLRRSGEIDVRLAAARHAEQDEGCKGAPCVTDGRRSGALVSVKSYTRGFRDRRGCAG